MNYIYNLYLNFNNTYYDFYDWNDKDNIISIKRIPIIKTNTKVFKEVITNYIKLSKDIYNKIKYKTDTKYKKYKNSFIITDSKSIIALTMDNKGNTKEISSFNLDDEYNILEYSKKLKEIDIKYKIIRPRKYILETRYDTYKKYYLLKLINKVSNDTIKYIYYDCYNKNSDNYIYMKKELIKEINNNTDISNQIFNILNLISTN